MSEEITPCEALISKHCGKIARFTIRLLIPSGHVTLFVCRACKELHELRANDLGYGYFSLFGTHHNKKDIEKLRKKYDARQSQENEK